MSKSSRKPKQKPVNTMRNSIILCALACLLCLVAYHSLNVYTNEDGRQGLTLEKVQGYQEQDSVYTIADAKEHYLLFSVPEQTARSAYIYLNQCIGADTPATVRLLYQGSVVDTINSSIPAADTYLAVVFENTSVDQIEVSIENTFSLNAADAETLYVRDDGAKGKLQQYVVIVLIILIVAALFAARNRKLDNRMNAIGAWFSQKFTYLVSHGKQVGIRAGFMVASVVAGNVAWAVLYRVFLKAGWTFTVKHVLFGGMLGIIVFLLVDYFMQKQKTFDVLFLQCALIMGTVLAIILPLHLNISWDDQIHFQDAAVVSRFNTQTTSLSENDFYNSCFFNQLKDYGNSDRSAMYSLLNNKDAKRAAAPADYKMSVASVVYVPLALILFLARGIGLPMGICVILGRMASAWFFFFVIYFGMRHLKSGKMVLAAVALIPTSVFIVANYNYDYWLVALTSYSIAYLIGEYQTPDKPITIKDLLFIFGAILLGGAAKPVYIPLIALAAFLPKTKFTSKKFQKGYYAFFIGVAACVAAGFAFFIFGGNLGTGDYRGGSEINATNQVKYILANPKAYMLVIFNFLKEYLSIPILQNDLVDTAYIPMKTWMGPIVMAWIVIVMVLDRNKEENKNIHWMVKAAVLPVAYGTAWCVATAMYVMFTPVGGNTVNGCSGRYLMSIYFPVAVVLSRIRFLVIPHTDKIKRIMEPAFLGISLLLSGIMMSIFM